MQILTIDLQIVSLVSHSNSVLVDFIGFGWIPFDIKTA